MSKKDGIGIMQQAGMVYLHFFAIERAIEMTPEQALDLASHINDMAMEAMKTPEEGLIIRGDA